MFKLPNMYVCKCNTKKDPNCKIMNCRKLYYPYYKDYRENFYLDKLREEVLKSQEDKKF